MNLRDMALSIIGRSPQVTQSPNARHMLGVIQSGDAEEWAANLVADYAPGILAETDEIARGW